MKSTDCDIDASSIEGELRELWEELARTEEGEHQAVMRACVLNLILFCGDDWDPQERGQALGEITSEHPSRIMVISPIPVDEELLEVEVTTRCHPVAGGRSHVCCEIIHFSVSQRSFDRVLSLIWSLQVPDLPTAVWWRSRPAPASRFFLSLVEMADRVILDNEHLDPVSADFDQLCRLIEQHMEQTSFSDLAWSRLTPWRRAVAGFSDVPLWKEHLYRVGRVEIFFRRSQEMPALSIRVLYLLSWLGSRLGWQLEKPLDNKRPTNLTLRKGDSTDQVIVVFNGEISTPEEAGITGIRLFTDDGVAATFEVWRADEQRYLQSRVLFDEQETGSRISHKYSQKESELVCRELEILGHDRVFEKAFRFAAGCFS